MWSECPSCGAALPEPAPTEAERSCATCGWTSEYEDASLESDPATEAELERMRQVWSEASEGELQAALLSDAQGFRLEAREIIRAEARRRGYGVPGRPELMRERQAHGRGSFRIGSVLGQSLSVWGGDLPRFFLLSLVVYLPAILISAWVLWTIGEGEVSVYGELSNVKRVWTGFLSGGLVSFLCGQLLTATLVAAVFQQLRGARQGMLRCLSLAVARLVPVLLAVVLGTLLGALPLVPCVVLMNLWGTSSGCLEVLLLLVGGFFSLRLFMGLAVAVPAVVVERLGAAAALRRSWGLTRERRLALLALLIVMGLFSWFFELGFELLDPLVSEPWGLALSWIPELLSGSLQAVLTCVAYFHLRVTREGLERADLAQIFE